MNRRRFILAAAATVSCMPILNSALASAPSRRVLKLHNRNTDEIVNVEYFVDGWYNPDAISGLNHFLRDWREDAVAEFDVGVFDILYTLQREGNGQDPIHVISGYRTPRTNSRLRSSNPAVASNSYHTRAMAVDLRFPGVSTRHLRDRAAALGAGGVGYYGRSNFLHIDTGPVRTW